MKRFIWFVIYKWRFTGRLQAVYTALTLRQLSRTLDVLE